MGEGTLHFGKVSGSRSPEIYTTMQGQLRGPEGRNEEAMSRSWKAEGRRSGGSESQGRN